MTKTRLQAGAVEATEFGVMMDRPAAVGRALRDALFGQQDSRLSLTAWAGARWQTACGQDVPTSSS